MGNGGYPRTDMNQGQNSKSKIQIFFWILLFWFSALGSNLSQVGPFPTSAGHPGSA